MSDKITAARMADGTGDLLGRTLRMVAVLVGACVLFVGALSIAAMAVTDKAVTAPSTAAESNDTPSTSPKKPAVSRPSGASSALPI